MKIIAAAYPDLDEGTRCSLSVLEDFGNIGSPSTLFVLDRALETGLRVTPSVQLLGIGPGMVMTLARLLDVRVV
jgi:predicted naringenin-chalcone synthase